MIKNAKEAREIVDIINNLIGCACGEQGHHVQHEAVGYLAALEGPEVKALVEAAEDALESLKSEFGNLVAMNNFGLLIGALKNYREAIKHGTSNEV